MTAATVFDTIRQEGGITSDRKLSVLLRTDKSVISKARAGIKPLSEAVILRIHEEVGMSVRRIRELAAQVDGASPIKQERAASFVHRCR